MAQCLQPQTMLNSRYAKGFDHLSVKHWGRYTAEFEGRHNCRPLDTEEQMGIIARGAAGKRMTYVSLTGPAETRQPRML